MRLFANLAAPNLAALFALLFLLGAQLAYAQSPSLKIESQSIEQFSDEMANRHHFDRGELDKLFSQAQHLSRVIQLVKPAPSHRYKNWQAYRARFVEPIRIQAGVEFWNAHRADLQRAEQAYGVPCEIIAAIIGIETMYGQNTGNFRLLDVLTTLAFDYPETKNREARLEFFKGELENFLLYAREQRLDPIVVYGSYAGAVGLPQFMPSSIRKWAVDFDRDGHIDLQNSAADAIGSVARFLAENGWKAGYPLVFEVKVNGEAWQNLLDKNLTADLSVTELQQSGVQSNRALPADLTYGLIDLQNAQEPTEYWVGTQNYFAITHYNRSFFYAMAVVDLAQALRTYLHAQAEADL